MFVIIGPPPPRQRRAQRCSATSAQTGPRSQSCAKTLRNTKNNRITKLIYGKHQWQRSFPRLLSASADSFCKQRFKHLILPTPTAALTAAGPPVNTGCCCCCRWGFFFSRRENQVKNSDRICFGDVLKRPNVQRAGERNVSKQCTL